VQFKNLAEKQGYDPKNIYFWKWARSFV